MQVYPYSIFIPIDDMGLDEDWIVSNTLDRIVIKMYNDDVDRIKKSMMLLTLISTILLGISYYMVQRYRLHMALGTYVGAYLLNAINRRWYLSAQEKLKNVKELKRIVDTNRMIWYIYAMMIINEIHQRYRTSASISKAIVLTVIVLSSLIPAARSVGISGGLLLAKSLGYYQRFSNPF